FARFLWRWSWNGRGRRAQRWLRTPRRRTPPGQAGAGFLTRRGTNPAENCKTDRRLVQRDRPHRLGHIAITIISLRRNDRAIALYRLFNRNRIETGDQDPIRQSNSGGDRDQSGGWRHRKIKHPYPLSLPPNRIFITGSC